jgi:hypothetical protein
MILVSLESVFQYKQNDINSFRVLLEICLHRIHSKEIFHSKETWKKMTSFC